MNNEKNQRPFHQLCFGSYFLSQMTLSKFEKKKNYFKATAGFLLVS